MNTAKNVVVSRRSVIVGAVAIAVTTAVSRPAEGATYALPTSNNRWPVIDSDNDVRLATFIVEGTGSRLTVAAGDAAVILGYVVRRFHYEIAMIRVGELLGFRFQDPKDGGHGDAYSSGIAVDIEPGLYPSGVSGGFFPADVVIIRDILAQCEGVVAWGGDNPQHPQEGHFELCVGPSDRTLKRVSARIQGDLNIPGRGPGAELDAPEKPERKDRAARLKPLLSIGQER